jgi:hypothetical protein
MTVVETEEFLRKAKPLMPDAEREELVAVLGANAEAGKIMPGTGGREKASLGPRRKRQARRLESDLLLPRRAAASLPAAYPKGEKANFSKTERNVMKRLIPILAADRTNHHYHHSNAAHR